MEISAKSFHLRKSFDSDFSIYQQNIPIILDKDGFKIKYNNQYINPNQLTIFIQDNVLLADMITFDEHIINNHKQYMIDYIKNYLNDIIK